MAIAPMVGSTATRSLDNGQMNGIPRVQDAPPSTLAAHLASNLSHSRRPSKHGEQEDFQRLLLEVSRHEQDPNRDTSIEAVIEHHHKLIYVVVKAVLEVLTRDDSVLNEQLLQQASDGLDILIVTIKETPEVLDHIADSDSQLQTGRNAPLWMWLFPRVLALVGRQRCDVLHEKITDFFWVSFSTVSKSLKLWTLNTSFFSYLRRCADGMHHFVNPAAAFL